MGTSVPPEWENHDPTDHVDGSYYFLFSCVRAGLNPLERPVSFLFEAHGAFSRPPECAPEHLDFIYVLERIYVNDTRFVEALDALQVPVAEADIMGGVETVASIVVRFAWSWMVEGGEESYFETPAYEAAGHDFSEMTRFVWFVDDAVHYVDMDMRIVSTYQNSNTQVGEVHDPMLYARVGLPAYVAQGNIATETSFTGQFGAYGDLLCETPSSS